MKLKNSVKLSALSLSLIALAVTSCGGSKNNDNKDPANAKEQQKKQGTEDGNPNPAEGGKPSPAEGGNPNPTEGTKDPLKAFDAKKVKKLIVSKTLSIPHAGCAPLHIQIENEDGSKSVADPTSAEFIIKLVGKNSNKFNILNGEVCAVKTPAAGESVPSFGDVGTVQVALAKKSTVSENISITVVGKENVKAVHVAPGSFNPNDSADLGEGVKQTRNLLRRAEAAAINATKTTLLPLGYDNLNIDGEIDRKIQLVQQEVAATHQSNYNKSEALTKFKGYVQNIQDAYTNISSQLTAADFSGSLISESLGEIQRNISGGTQHLDVLITQVQIQKGTAKTAVNNAQAAYNSDSANTTKKDELNTAIRKHQAIVQVERQLGFIQTAYNNISSNFDGLSPSITVTDYTIGANIPSVATTPSTKDSAAAILTTLTTDISNLQSKVQNYNRLKAVETALGNVKIAQQNYAQGGVVFVPAGDKVIINVAKTVAGNNAGQALSANDEVSIYDHFHNKLPSRVLPTKPGQNYTEIEFTAPKAKTNGVVTYKASVNSFESTFSVQVNKAAYTAFQLVTGGRNGPLISEFDVLEADQTYYASILAHKTDDTKVNLTYDNASKDVTVSQGSGSSAYTMTSVAAPLLPNYFAFSSAQSAGFNPQELKIQVDSENLDLKLYINAKPVITGAQFKVGGNQLSGNALTVAVGSIHDVSGRCAQLQSVKYDLGTSRNLSFTDAQIINNIKLSLSNSEKFEIQKDSESAPTKLYVCATEKADKGDSVAVTVASLKDSNVNKTFTFTASDKFKTNKAAVINGSELAKPDYSIALSSAVMSHILDIRYLNSDGSVSDDVVTSGVSLVADPTTNDFFETSTAEGVYTVKLKTDAAAKLKTPNNVASHVIRIQTADGSLLHTNSVTTIPVTFTK